MWRNMVCCNVIFLSENGASTRLSQGGGSFDQNTDNFKGTAAASGCETRSEAHRSSCPLSMTVDGKITRWIECRGPGHQTRQSFLERFIADW